MPSREQVYRNHPASSKQRATHPKTPSTDIQDAQVVPASAAQKTPVIPQLLRPHDVQQLQHTVGNQTINRFLAQTAQPPQLQQTIPQSPLIQRKLILDGKEIKTLEDLGKDLNTECPGVNDTITKLINLPGNQVVVTTAQLKKVHAYITGPKKNPPHPEDAGAILAIMQLLSYGAWTRGDSTATYQIFGSEEAKKGVKDLGRFLAFYPNIAKNLEAAGVGWELGSHNKQLDALGGGGIVDEKIHIAPWVFQEEEFLGMVSHEMGHATFQRMLIRGEDWTNEANEGTEKPNDKALVEDGREFYAAWKVIRQNPKNFYIVDLPGEKGSYAKGESRGKYLAGGFNEFCAESFKHLARGEMNYLEDHVNKLPGEEAEAKAAWGKAIKILRKYEDCLLGKNENSGAITTLRNHRFITALSKLKKELKGPGLEVADVEIAKKGVVNLQLAWLALTGSEKDQYRSDTYTILDLYFQKVLRRRPAQANFGSELGFTGL